MRNEKAASCGKRGSGGAALFGGMGIQARPAQAGGKTMNGSSNTGTLTSALESVAARLGMLSLTPTEALTDPQREEVLIRYVIGTGEFSKDGKYINIKTKAYKLNGEDDGTYIGVDEPVFKNVMETFGRPNPPEPPFDQPAGPMIHVVPLSFSKGLRTFPDGSTITAIGPANLHVVSYVDGASQFWVTSNLIITNGTGRYQGAHGVKIVGGSTWVEPGKPITALDIFSVKTVEVYRIVRSEFIARR
jgi:hypothetical protein